MPQHAAWRFPRVRLRVVIRWLTDEADAFYGWSGRRFGTDSGAALLS